MMYVALVLEFETEIYFKPNKSCEKREKRGLRGQGQLYPFYLETDEENQNKHILMRRRVRPPFLVLV